MFEFSSAEFDGLMIAKPTFRKVGIDPMVVGGSVALGVEELVYSDGFTTVKFTGSNSTMHLRIERKVRKKPVEVLVNQSFTDFGAVREALAEHTG